MSRSARQRSEWVGKGSRAVWAAVAAAVWACAVGCAEVEVEPADATRDYDAALAALRGRASEPLPVGGALQVSLPADGRRRYTLELRGSAELALRATPAGAGARVKLEVERAPAGAGSRPLAAARGRPGHAVELTRTLSQGRYVVSVMIAGGAPSEVTVAASCSGAGCPEVEVSCLFGDTFAERDALPRLELVDELRVYSEAELGTDPVVAQQVIAALHTSSHTDVSSVAQAFAAVDAGELRRVRFVGRDGGARYVAWEYGAGDNSYGAFFADGASQVLAAIHDGDVLNCVSAVP